MDYLSLGGTMLFVIMAGAGIVPLIMAFRLKVFSLRILSALLGLFAIVHGFYHLAFGYQQQYLADVILEPTSLILLLAFGLYYSKIGVA